MYIYSPTLYITYTHTRIDKYFFFFFRAVGSGRFECLSVSALVALARRCGGEHIILRDVYGIIYLFILFFLAILAHAHVCAYMYACTYVYACAYTYTYTCAHDSHNIYQCAIFATLWSGGGRFFVVFRWLVD